MSKDELLWLELRKLSILNVLTFYLKGKKISTCRSLIWTTGRTSEKRSIILNSLSYQKSLNRVKQALNSSLKAITKLEHIYLPRT